MAYSELLADRVRRSLTQRNVFFAEKKMMGGLTFMVDDKMCIGILQETLMARIDPDHYDTALTRPGCREMDFTGRPMKGFLFIDAEGTDHDEDMEFWVQECLDFNPRAKSSKKK
ncbi:MAG: TfoX/Sxy family protein [Bacteroidia bacterium]|nr:TfoX/Sxy family protein [Bacteroidia bacterium]